jgi:hypothetical protein
MLNLLKFSKEKIDLHNRTLCHLMSKDFLAIDIIIPNEQRIRDDDKVDEIVQFQLEQLKHKGQCNFMGLINIHYCNTTRELYLVDGQHRYEAIRKINQSVNIPIAIELVIVDTMLELISNYKMINMNTQLPDFPENIDKNIPEKAATFFKLTFPHIWSKNSHARRPYIYFNFFQEALGVLTEKLQIDSKHTLIQLVNDCNLRLSKWTLSSFPDNKNINLKMLQKCQEHQFYLGLFKHVSDKYRFDWVKDICRQESRTDIHDIQPIHIQHKKQKSIKKNISKSLKTKLWDKFVGKDKRSALCICCVHNVIKVENFHAGHILAEIDGGLTNEHNLIPICSICNLSMGSINMNSFVYNNFPSNYDLFLLKIYTFD